MNPDELVAIRERADAATEGPWEADRPQVWGPNGESVAFVSSHDPGEGSGQPEWEANAVFIAHAREDVPALLDHVDALTDQYLKRTAELHEKVDLIRETVVARSDRLSARLAAVRELHKPCECCADADTGPICSTCSMPSPCPTRQVIEGDPDGPDISK